MSFQPFEWTYTPPETLAPAPPTAYHPANASVLTGGAPATASRAAQLIARLDALNATAKYLESAILARGAGIGITLDLNNQPELVLALSRLYGEVPDGISVAMYGHLLDALVGTQRVAIAIDETQSDKVVDPVQMADLVAVTGAFEKTMTENGSFDHQLPLLLKTLKGDRLAFDNLTEGLQQYPVMQPAPAVTAAADNFSPVLDAAGPAIDVHPDTTTNLNGRLDVFETYYNAVNGLAGQLDSVTMDIASIAQAYVLRPLSELVTAISMLKALKAFFTKPSLGKITGIMDAIILPRLIAQVSKFNFLMDQALQKAISPVQNLINSLGSTIATASRMPKQVSYLVSGMKSGPCGSGNFTGGLNSHISGSSKSLASSVSSKLDQMSIGVAKLGGYLSWGSMEMQRKRDYLEMSTMRILDRKLDKDGNHLETLQALSAIESLTGITASFLNIKSGGGAPYGSPLPSIQSAVSQVLNSPGLPPAIPTPAAQYNLPEPPTQAKAVFAAAQARSAHERLSS